MNDNTLAVRKLPPLDKVNEKKERNSSVPMYTLNNTKHVLPPPKALRPYLDTHAGELDMWPAHAGAHGSGANVYLSHKKNLVVVKNTKEDASIPPKPRFLDQLETFLTKELTALNANDVEASDVRLQAHREVFEYLIEDFRSYRPLLSAIKNEYEMMLSKQRQKIHDLEPLKQILVNVSEQCDRKIMALRDSEKENLNELNKSNQQLVQKIGALNNEICDLREQVVRLQEELGLQYEKYRTECDARKLLIADMNNLRYQQEDHILSQDSMDDMVEEQQDDPTTLKIALKQARLDEKKASERLNGMLANYSDVIPRRDHETMEKEFNELTENHAKLQDQFQKIQVEYNALLDLQSRMKDERDRFFLEGEQMKRSATPRPDWDKCIEYIEGGEERWASLIHGKNSNEIVDVLLKEVAAGSLNISGSMPFFDGRGTSDSIPGYLRCDGPVKNRYLTKRDCLLLIMDIWREKVSNDSQLPDNEKRSLSDFLVRYFRASFPLESMAIEWGYNFHDACSRYSDDDDTIAVFWGILNDEINEEVYHRLLQDISLLLTHLTVNDDGDTGLMTKSDFRCNLALFFVGISDEMLSTLCQCAERELESESLEFLQYKNLFMEDDEGQTGPFLFCVKDFLKEQKMGFVSEIMQQLAEIDPVTRIELKQALALSDPEIESETLENYCDWVFLNIPEGEEALDKVVIEKRLKDGDIWKKVHIKVFYD